MNCRRNIVWLHVANVVLYVEVLFKEVDGNAGILEVRLAYLGVCTASFRRSKACFCGSHSAKFSAKQAPY